MEARGLSEITERDPTALKGLSRALYFERGNGGSFRVTRGGLAAKTTRTSLEGGAHACASMQPAAAKIWSGANASLTLHLHFADVKIAPGPLIRICIFEASPLAAVVAASTRVRARTLATLGISLISKWTDVTRRIPTIKNSIFPLPPPLFSSRSLFHYFPLPSFFFSLVFHFSFPYGNFYDIEYTCPRVRYCPARHNGLQITLLHARPTWFRREGRSACLIEATIRESGSIGFTMRV